MTRKQTILGTLILTLACGCACAFSPAARAEEINQGTIEMPDDSGYTETNTESVNLEERNSSDAENQNQDAGPEDNNDGSVDINAITGGRNIEDDSGIETTNIDDNSSTVNFTEDAEVEEPSAWPMIISLCALGAVIVAIIVLNLFGRRKK